MTATLHMRIRGVVASAVCRTTTAGLPLVEVLLTDAAGQEVRARHAYASGTPASHYAASALARRLRGQEAELEVLNLRFRARRLDCDAAHIYLAPSSSHARKDLE
jgi:hypothetical protein